jgi:serine/threonine-protein kinase
MRYQTAVPLGEGGMGTVYRAFDPVLGRPVALKFLRGDNPALAQRLLREARLQARVDHEHVCRVYEAGESEGRPYIAMQYIEGQTLDRVAPTLSLEQKVRVMREVAEAVHAANRIGLVHRDLKPGNVMVEVREEGLHPYVLDFGLAREVQAEGLTETGLALGSPPYMAPEQARGEIHALDRRTDVYALGAVLYELLCGRPPFQGRSTVEILVKVLHEEPEAPRRLQPRLPVDLETVALKCLEKEPPRRYDSARALAEDLGRFLDGEPVRAQPARLGYRLARKARKHRAALAAGAAGLVLVGTLMALWLRARWTSSERALLAQRFGQEVERMEGGLRQAYLLPRHDTRAAREQVRERLKRLGADMVRLGPVSYGPGSSALGRGHLALGEHAKAREHLERAWSLGQQDPETAQALGRTLGALYREALDDAKGIKDEAEQGRRRRELEATLRDPALTYLGVAGAPAREYAQALIAHYEGRHEDALRHLERASDDSAEAAEARLLQGRVWVAVAGERESSGDPAGALEALEEAGRSYAAGAEIARSSPEVLGAECERWASIIETRETYGRQEADAYAQALRSCETAASVDPDRAGPHVSRSRILWRWAEYRENHGQPGRAQTDDAIAAARRAVALDARDAATFNNLGLALWTRAEEASAAGQDPRALLREAAEAVDKAAALRPSWVSAAVNLCGIHHLIGDWELAHGLDPEPALVRAEKAARGAVELSPQTWQAHNNLGMVFWTRAHAQLFHGRDPSGAIDEGRRSFERALSLNPKGAFAHNNLAGVESLAAQFALWRGQDPLPALERMRAAARAALSSKPGYVNGEAALVLADALDAERLLERGALPEAVIGSGRKAVLRALAIDAGNVGALTRAVRLELAAARWAMRAGKPPAPAFRAAARHIQVLSTAGANDPDAESSAAAFHRWHAEWVLSRGLSPAEDVRRGLSAADRVLALRPGDAEAKALAAGLHLAAARAAGDAMARSRAAAQASVLLREALELNPLMARQQQDLAREAARLAGAVSVAER